MRSWGYLSSSRSKYLLGIFVVVDVVSVTGLKGNSYILT